jgi:hypothetical protein
MIEWNLGVGEFVKKIMWEGGTWNCVYKERMCANVVLINQHVCVKKPPMKPQHIYACKILQMKKLVMY